MAKSRKKHERYPVRDKQPELFRTDSPPEPTPLSEDHIESHDLAFVRRQFLKLFCFFGSGLMFGNIRRAFASSTTVTLGGTASGFTYIDDIFSSYLYVGSGTSQNVNNGLALASKGGLVWQKTRSAVGDHYINYSDSGAPTYILRTNTMGALVNESSSVSSFSGSGFNTIGPGANTQTVISFTFLKSAKFFDVVNYTGNGVSGRQISHSLGISPGMIVVKCTNASSQWAVYHRGLTDASYCLKLNTTDAQAADSTVWTNIHPTSSAFTVGSSALTNTNGASYVAFLFAHDAGADGVIQCGQYVGNGSSNGVEISLGWEPQFVLKKRIDSSDSGNANWMMSDVMRGIDTPGNDRGLYTNLGNSENGSDNTELLSNGFVAKDTGTGGYNQSGASYIYLAIRRPNKRATEGWQVFHLDKKTTGGDIRTTQFVADLVISSNSGTDASNWQWVDRLRGMTSQFASFNNDQKTTNPFLVSSTTAAEATTGCEIGQYAAGYSGGTQYGVGIQPKSTGSYYGYFFRRAAGFFDVVCYKGSNATGATWTFKNHSLGVVPELIIVKSRTSSANWSVRALTSSMALNMSAGSGGVVNYFDTTSAGATTTQFKVYTDGGGATGLDANGVNYVAYLFATLPGVSKVGTYSGSVGDVVVPCGFVGSARFVLVKRTDSTGDWIVVDSTRGQNRYSLFNSTNPEVSANVISLTAGGFTAKAGTVANAAAGASYIFLAIS